MQKRCAFKIQENAFGGLSVAAKARLEELIGELELPFGNAVKPPRATRDDGLVSGATITKVWHGRTYRVHITDDAFEWDGRRFRSLTAVASAITGSKWSGPLFFGLKKKAAVS
jgi:hypothetical protein